MDSPFAIPDNILYEKVKPFLVEDLHDGDLSSGLIPAEVKATAHIIAKSSGIISGLDEARVLFSAQSLEVKSNFHDGDAIQKGEELMIIIGNLRNILMVERTALNFLMKLSSIATSTHDLVLKMRDKGYNTRLATTRKTDLGLSWFEKKAVFYGRGDTHRWNLGDMILLKDTHRDFFNDLPEMIAQAKVIASFSKKIEVEIEDPSQISVAIGAGADIIMLDNMSPEIITQSLESIQKPDHIFFEASGNITHENLLKYAATGVDIISTSQTILYPHIHVDYSLKLIKN